MSEEPEYQYITELRFERGDQPSKFFYYRIPVVSVFDRTYPGGYYRWAGKINCFFHRHATDGIHWNRTNLRQFTRKTQDEWDGMNGVMDSSLAKAGLPPQVRNLIELTSLDEFFEKVGFVYKTKTWRCQTEWAMKFDPKTFRYVNP